MASDTSDVVIAVMGPTGVGKSSFVKLVSGRDDVSVGDRLVSETNKITPYRLQLGTGSIVLVDTPGFDDTYISDRDVLRTLSRWLEQSYQEGQLLTGILYLHRISDPRMQGSALRNLYMFRKLCGKDAMPNIVLGTTFWDTMAQNLELAEAHENELIESHDMWGTMISGGSKAVRLNSNKVEMIQLLTTAFDNTPHALNIQKELVDEGKFIDDTDAGKILLSLKLLVKEHEEKLRAASVARDREIALQKERHEQKLAEREREWQVRMQEEAETRARRDREANEALQEMQEQLRRLEAQNSNLSERLGHGSSKQFACDNPEMTTEKRQSRLPDVSCIREDILRTMDDYLFRLSQERSKGMISFVSKPFSGGNTRFCDVCFSTIGASTYYICPSCYDGGFNICRSCHENGFTCGEDGHIQTYLRQRETNNKLYCPRMVRPPNLAPLPCHRCRKDVGFCYFHCCNCLADSFDLCFECALRGKKCVKFASSGGHPMSMYFRPALLAARSSERAKSFSGVSSPSSDVRPSPIHKTATWNGQSFRNSSTGTRSPQSPGQLQSSFHDFNDNKQIPSNEQPVNPSPPPLPKRAWAAQRQ